MITSFTSLKDALRERLTHASLDDATALDVIIQLAQKRIERALAHIGYSPKTEEVANGALTNGDAEMSLPVGCLDIKAFYVEIEGEYTIVLQQPRAMHGLNASLEGTPEFYYVQGDKAILSPVPDAAYGYRIEYVKEAAPLSTTNETNWYVERAPDVLFYSALLEAADYMRETEKFPQYDAAYNTALGGLIDSIQRERYGSAPLLRRVAYTR